MKQVAPGVRARWWPAGHILGAASIEVEIADSKGVLRLLFSGDLGPGGRDTIDDPEAPTGVDHVILESTYGDRERPQTSSAERRKLLADEVRLAHAAGGPLVIPAFAVERTQELIVDLLDLLDENLVPPAPIFLDSPLAIKACEVFLRRGRTRDGEKPFEALRESRFLHFTESVGESRNLARVRGWHIIIAASGMCDAGRIRHHLKRLLWRPEATVLMVGYQAVGTLGRFLLEGSRRVRIQGEQIAVRARIREIDVYSGHANAQGLVRWAKGCEPIRGKIFLTHGEPPSLKGLAQRLEGAGFQQDAIVVAGLDRAYQLTHSTAEAQASDIRLPEGAVSSLDWHNARSALLLSLDKRLRDAGSDKERREVLESLLQTLKGSAP
jgi:metallo-beta-lactamase family protein